MADEQLCSGCGAVAANHPFVGVARDAESELMTAYPICYLCWVDPAHRQHPLKMHFFEAKDAPTAVKAAEDNILAEKPSGSQQ